MAKLPKREELYALKTVKKSPTYFEKKLIRTTNTDEEYADKLFMEKTRVRKSHATVPLSTYSIMATE